jgi:serine/threonine protein kinase
MCVKVYRAKTLARGDAAVIKMLDREFFAIAGLQHPGITRVVRLFVEREEADDAAEDDGAAGPITAVQIVLERAPAMPDGPAILAVPAADRSRYGGPAELYRYAVGRGPMSEGVARFVLAQLLAATAAMHAARVIHRDLKMENALVFGEATTSAGAVPIVKVTDFGAARALPAAARASMEMLTVNGIGSKQYIAPEFYWPDMDDDGGGGGGGGGGSGGGGGGGAAGGAGAPAPAAGAGARGAVYGEKVDVYALGVTLFAALTAGELPYTDRAEDDDRSTDAVWLPRLRAGAIRWRAVEGAGAGEECLDLLRWMLARQPSVRLSARQALAHEWFDPIREEYAAVFGDPILQTLVHARE